MSEHVEVELAVSEGRLDKALAEALPQLSRARIQALMADGAVTRDGETVDDPSARSRPGCYRLSIPPAVPADPQGEALDFTIL